MLFCLSSSATHRYLHSFPTRRSSDLGQDVDMRSDIWSVGTTLYEAVVGNVAFNAASVTEIFSMVLEKAPEPMPAHVPEGLRSEEHTSELQSRGHLVCRLLLEKKKSSA